MSSSRTSPSGITSSRPGSSNALAPIGEADYGAIESAVMETQRGRWFLAEYARRNRNADTTVLLAAIDRLENAVSAERETQRMDRLRFDLVEMARAITSTKREIAAIRPGEGTPSDLEVASEALDGIVRTTERATSDILDAAEHVQEAAWTLREDGAREDLCDELDRRATDIYTHCSFQDLTAQRTKRIIETLRFLEGRINAMMDIWGASLDDADAGTADDDRPQTRHQDLGSKLDVFQGLGQTEIDDVIVEGQVVTVLEPVVDVSPPGMEPVADDVAWNEAEETAFAQAESAEVESEAADAFEIEDAVEVTDPLAADPEPAELALDASDVSDEADEDESAVAAAGPAFSAEAFAEIDGLGTREKLARFS
ncbi:hypothetical protein [Salinarimonas chemoclinalis]|uniref:hypothetical protein n=1 Tax=Salinarimonas chemoclinalis TaxID=3241599 RepID=UPI0035562AE8